MEIRELAPLDDYRIQKHRLDVTLALAHGTTIRGHIFVHLPVPGHHGFDDPAVLLNDRDPFFPMETESGEVLLIAKSQVAELSGLPVGEEDELLRRSTPMALLEVRLAGGISHYGSMRLEVRTGRPRLLDFLNDATQHFLTLYTDQGIRLINRAWIECVRPLD